MRLLVRSQFRRPPRRLASTPLSSAGANRIDRSIASSPAPPLTIAGERDAGISDEQLLAWAHDRRPGIEAMVYRRFSSLVRRLVWRLLGPDSEYQDTIHDVFVRIFRGIGSLRDASRFEEWATRVAINTVKNEFRRRKLRRFISLEDGQDAGHPQYQPDFEHRELLARTYRVLERLPADERIALTFDLFETGTIADIAASIGVSLRTIKRRLKAGRERFERLAKRDPVLAPWLANRSPTGGRQ